MTVSILLTHVYAISAEENNTNKGDVNNTQKNTYKGHRFKAKESQSLPNAIPEQTLIEEISKTSSNLSINVNSIANESEKNQKINSEDDESIVNIPPNISSSGHKYSANNVSDFIILEDYLNYLTDEEKEDIQAKYLIKLGHKYQDSAYREAKHQKMSLALRIQAAQSKTERHNLRQRLLAQKYITTLGHKFKKLDTLLNQQTLSKTSIDSPALQKPIKGKILSNIEPLTPTPSPSSQEDLKKRVPNLILPTKGETHSQIPDGEELLLVLKIDDLVLDAIFAFKENNGAFIGLESLFSVLDFPIDIDTNAKQAKGWFIRENNYFNLTKLKTDSNIVKVTLEDNEFIVPENNIRFEDDDIYVHSNELFKWLEFKYKLNFNDLTLTIKPKVKLPLQLRLARESRLGKVSIAKIKEPILPLRDTPYKIFSIPFIDVQVNANNNSSNKETRVNYSLLGMGDLAYMTASYFINGTENQTINNTKFRLDKESTNNDLLGPLNLSKISIGDISAVKLPFLTGGSPQEKGLRISNSLINKATNFNSTSFDGDILPNWDIELYHNDVLIESQRAGNDGRYEFTDINLYYGKNEFKMIFYGPQGQVRERFENIPVNTTNIMKGKFFYDLSVTKQNSPNVNEFININNNGADENYRFSTQFQQGISDSISMQGGLTSYNFLDGTRHNIMPIGFDIFTENAKFNIGYIKDFNGGSAYEGNVKTQLNKQNVDFTVKQFTEDYQTDIDEAAFPEKINTVKLSGPLLSINNVNLNYALSASNSKTFNDTTNNFYSFFTGTNIDGYILSNSLFYNKLTLANDDEITAYNGNLKLTKYFNSYRLRSRIDYSIEPEAKFTNIDTALLWPISNNLLSEVSLGINERVTTGRMNLSWDTELASLTAFATYNNDDAYAFGLNFRFSLGINPKTNRFKMSRNRIASTGGISARVFEDVNNDGIYNNNEPLIEGAKISGVNARKSAYSDPSGIAFLTGLPKNRITDVKLELDSLEDPFWLPLNEGFSFMPRPGLVESFDIPIVTSGEIDGIIYIENQDKTSKAGRYVPLELIDEDGGIFQSTNSEFDGFYLFSSIKPGKYNIRIKPSYLLNKNLVQLKQHKLIIKGNGTVISGENITLHHKDNIDKITQEKNRITIPPEHFLINLGRYHSPSHANITWLMLRKTYPEISLFTRSIFTNKNNEAELKLFVPNKQKNLMINWCNKIKRQNKVCFSE